MGGITAAFAYHAARDVFPHNPRRKVHLMDRGELHFRRPTQGSVRGLGSSPVSTGCPRPRRARRGLSGCRRARSCGERLDRVPPPRPPRRLSRTAHSERFRRPVSGRPLPCESRRPRRTRAPSSSDVCRYGVTSILADSSTTTVWSTAITTSATSSSSAIAPGSSSGLASASTAWRSQAGWARRCGGHGALFATSLEDVFAAGAAPGTQGELARGGPGRGRSRGWRHPDARAQTVATLAAEATEICSRAWSPVRVPRAAVPSRATRREAGRRAGGRISWRVGVDLTRLGRRVTCSRWPATHGAGAAAARPGGLPAAAR